jgi:hypothetical protein
MRCFTVCSSHRFPSLILCAFLFQVGVLYIDVATPTLYMAAEPLTTQPSIRKGGAGNWSLSPSLVFTGRLADI